jgi:hypothetical protein
MRFRIECGNLLENANVEDHEVYGLDLSDICCEDGRWMKLAQGDVYWCALVLAVWLRAGRPGDRGSIPGSGKGFFL